MAHFKRTALSTLPFITEPLSESAKYWKNALESAKVAKELSAINCIDINSSHDLLLSSSTRLAIYEYYSLEVKRSFTTPSYSPLYGAHYRKSDDKLIVSGCGDGVVRVWDVKNSKPLRSLGDKKKELKHKSAVHRTHFFGSSQVVSLGDDKCIKLWDITEESLLSSIGDNNNEAHNDYIRASQVNESLSLVISGSYDKSVKIWDIRCPQKSVNNFSHGSPVEAITTRNLCVISVGGDTIKVHDLIAGKVMKTLVKTHHKTITCAYNYGTYLLTGSLDGHLKVYDSDFNVATTLTYSQNQLLCCAFNDKVLAVGANDGIFSVNKFKVNSTSIDVQNESNRNKSNKTRYFKYETVDDSFWKRVNSKPMAVQKRGRSDEFTNVKVEPFSKRARKLNEYDKLLKGFNYTQAFDKVMKSKEQPDIVVSFMQELIRRGALKAALAGRSDHEIRPIIDFLVKHMSDPRFSRILVDVAIILTDIYIPSINRTKNIQLMFKRLNTVINNELNCMQQMLQISGQISALINYSIK